MSETQKMHQPQNHRVDPLQRVLVEADEVLSFWPEVRDDEDLAPRNAWKLLALWAHLRRFPEDRVNRSTKAAVDAMVEDDKERLIKQMLRYPADGWLEEARQLDGAWDWLHTAPELHDLGYHAWELFYELDRFSLAAYAADRLLSHDNSCRTELAARKGQVDECEKFLRNHPDVFFPASSLASLYLLAYRPNLDEDEKELWLTTLKHRVLEELLEEANEPVPHARLNENELVSIRAIVRKLVEHETVIPFPERKDRHLEEQALSLDMAAERKAESPDKPKGTTGHRFMIGELNLDNIVFEVLTSDGRVFLRPYPKPPYTHLQVREKLYLLKRSPAHEDCEVVGLGRLDMEDFLDARYQAPAQHTVTLVSVDKRSK